MTISDLDTRTIGTIARDHPPTLQVLDRFGIDYCCHGGDTLDRACARAGADLEGVRLALQSVPADTPNDTPAERSWADESMAALCDHIETVHHALARDLFARCDNLLPRVLQAHGERERRWHEIAREVRSLRDEMFDHMVREERVLFPWLRRLENPGAVTIGPPWSIKRPIDCMMHDHDAVGAALRRLRNLTDGFAPSARSCGSVISLVQALAELDRDTRLHVHKENNILFPAGIRAEQDRARRSQPAPAGATT